MNWLIIYSYTLRNVRGAMNCATTSELFVNVKCIVFNFIITRHPILCDGEKNEQQNDTWNY